MSKSRDIVDLAAVLSKSKVEPVETSSMEAEEVKPKVVRSRKPKAMELVEKKLKIEKKEEKEVKPAAAVKVMPKVEEEKPKAVRPKKFEKGSDEARAWAQKMREAKLAKKAAKDAEPILEADSA